MRASFYGRTDPIGELDHQVQFRVNGTIVGQTSWSGRTHHTGEITFDNALIGNGLNRFKLEYQEVAIPDIYYLDWIEIEYPRETVAIDNRLQVTSAGGLSRYEVSNFSNSTDPMVLDVSVALAPVQLTGIATSGAGPFTLSFEDESSAGDRYLITNASGRESSVDLELDSPSDLRNSANGADLIIITPEGWESSVNALVAARTAQGLRVITANLTDVADEFSGGNEDDIAIRDFISWAYYNWQPPAVASVLLIGQPNIDPQNWLNRRSVSHFMPTHFGVTTTQGETISDTWFGAVDGDHLPDVAIGRISELKAVQVGFNITKILAYDNVSETRDWLKKIVHVASNEAAFETSLENSSSMVPDLFRIERQYRRQGATATSISTAITDGALLVTFVGHGNVPFWADASVNGIYYRTGDATVLGNFTRLPMILAMNCLNGSIADPITTTSLSEAFANNNSGGSLAMWSPSAVGFLAQYSFLQNEYYETLFVRHVRGIGAATTFSLVETYLNEPVSIDLVKEMVLLGDPSGELKIACHPTPDDNCNGFDEDCGGVPDDDYVSSATSCGIGACLSSGVTECVAGTVVNDCAPGEPIGEESVCNGMDDDCDGLTDEDGTEKTPTMIMTTQRIL